MTTTITGVDRLTILKFLADGRDVDFTAAATKHTRDTVLDVARHHGYPDTDKLAWAVDVVAKQLDDDARTSIPTATTRVVEPVPTRRPAPAPRPTPVPAPAPAPDSEQPDDVAALIALGKKSTRARTRGLADKAEKALATLRKEVETEVTAKREAAARAAEESNVRAEVARLEAELAAKRALLPKSQAAQKAGSTASRLGVDAKQVRAWARTAGVHCPPVGRVPRAVMDAYTAAHTNAAA